MAAPRIRPIILAGGLGTRLRPRTLHLPKPLLPVDGRPLLWYALNAVRVAGLPPAIVTLDYKSELISAFFDGAGAEFRYMPGITMAETVLQVVAEDDAAGILGMSADVILQPSIVREIVEDFSEHGRDTVLITQLPTPGHKKWEFQISGDMLTDIALRETVTRYERVLVIFRKESIAHLAETLPRPVADASPPSPYAGFQSGWILLLKALVREGIPVRARLSETPICNINVPDDFPPAEAFVREYVR